MLFNGVLETHGRSETLCLTLCVAESCIEEVRLAVGKPDVEHFQLQNAVFFFFVWALRLGAGKPEKKTKQEDGKKLMKEI